MHYSYDYADLIREVESDLKEGLLQPAQKMKIIRSERVVYEDYRPIIDYYSIDSALQNDFQIMTTEEVLEEMRYHDQLMKFD